MDIREFIRHIREGRSDRSIADTLGVNRKPVARYRAWAAEQGLLEGDLPELGNLQRMLDETMTAPSGSSLSSGLRWSAPLSGLCPGPLTIWPSGSR